MYTRQNIITDIDLIIIIIMTILLSFRDMILMGHGDAYFVSKLSFVSFVGHAFVLSA
jgi:hypothetical protein